MTAKQKSPDDRVEGFNRAHAIGTKVLYRSYPGATHRATQTRSEAWVLGGHTPVVMIEGTAGGVALDALVIVPPESL